LSVFFYVVNIDDLYNIYYIFDLNDRNINAETEEFGSSEFLFPFLFPFSIKSGLIMISVVWSVFARQEKTKERRYKAIQDTGKAKRD
jgi:hypothetical protein